MNEPKISPLFKPMLAAGMPKGMDKGQFFDSLRYPVYATPKLDGIRCCTIPLGSTHHPEWATQTCVPMTRSMKLIPNKSIRSLLSHLPSHLDGEIVATGSFQNTQSAVMSENGEWDFKYYVFDTIPRWQVDDGWDLDYLTRIERLKEIELPEFCVKLIPKEINRGELEAYEAEQIAAGFEGGIIRTANSLYKFGRSTFREQWMVKLKQFVDDEALVIGYEEEYHNANEAKRNALGNLERTSHSANMVGKGRLGALVVKHHAFGEFNIGTGFSAGDREILWGQRESLPGRIATFKYQPQGMKIAPRIPVFKAFRDINDLSAERVAEITGVQQQELL